MDDTLTIIPLRWEDHDQWLALWNDYLCFYETIIDESVKEVIWSRLLDP